MNNSAIENRFDEILNTIKNNNSYLLESNPNTNVSIHYIKGSIGLENHNVSRLSISLNNGISSVSCFIISGADKQFGDIDIKDEYITSYLSDEVKIKKDFEVLFNKLNTNSVRQIKEDKRVQEISINKQSLIELASLGIGVLRSFINRPDYFVLLSPVNSDYLLHIRNNTFAMSGRRYNFGICVKIKYDGFEIKLYGRPINAIGSGLNLGKFYFNSSEYSEVIKFIKKYSTETAIREVIRSFMSQTPIYS